MGAIILPSRFSQQPTQVVPIKMENPLSQGLISAFNFGTSLRDRVSGEYATLYTNARIETRAGVVGVGNFGDGTSCLYLPDLSTKLGSQFTVAWVTAGANSSDQGFGNLSTDANTEHAGYGGTYYVSGATPRRLSFAMPSGMRPYDQNTVLIASNTLKEWSAYQNRFGKIGGAAIYEASNGWPASASLGGPGGSFQYTGIFAGFFAWNRQLSDSEARLFVDAPWNIFQAPSTRIWVNVGGGGGSTAYTLTCASGTYTTSGKTATLTYARTLVCSSGAYTTSGKVATLQVAHKLICASGTYTTSGKAATLTYVPGAGPVNRTLTCDVGSYAFSGKAVTLTVNRKLICASGTYTTSGKSTTLTVAHSLQCASGTYVVSGKAATLTYTSHGPVTYTLTCSSGSYVMSGKAATLTYVGHIINVSEPEYTVYLQKRQFKTTLQKRSFRIYS